MKITHLGHSCVLVESAETQVLIDPGIFSAAWRQLVGLDAIVVTHQHPDHFDSEHGAKLIAANAGAVVCMEPQARHTFSRGEVFEAGEERQVGGLTLRTVGGEHAVIHPDIARIGNIGVVVDDDSTRFFHPGDCLDAVPEGIDVLAVPAYGPWAAMKETIEFVRAVGARDGFLIHEGLLNERGWQLTFDRLNEMTNTTFHDLREGTARDF